MDTPVNDRVIVATSCFQPETYEPGERITINHPAVRLSIVSYLSISDLRTQPEGINDT